MTDHVQLTINTYNQIAADYAAETENRANDVERKEMLLLLHPGGSLLDVGCASGKDAAFFQAHGFSTLGIDLSDELLKQAQKYHPEISVKKMDMRYLDFPEQSFDGVWAHASLLHLKRSEILPTLKNFYKILKTGGICYVMVKAGQGDLIKTEDHSLGKERFFTFFSLSEMEKYFAEAGFKLAKSYQFNGMTRDKASRDQNWIVIFGQKS